MRLVIDLLIATECGMASLGNILLEKEILLESGTNELEILIFRLGDYTFGINVAKVREVLPRGPITALPKSHPSVLGAFRLRETVVPVVSLRRHLEVPLGEQGSDQTLILADFNCQQTAFVVDSVERIHRISWEHILAVPAINSLSHSPVTAVARIGERLVIMLDFEMITDQVTEQLYRSGGVENPLRLPREKLRILLADDSPTVREGVTRTLSLSGYTHLRCFVNGREAWEWLFEQAQTKPLGEFADLLISDVEMPQIDGLHLTKRIKEHPLLKELPVLLYSSIVTPDNHKKGATVGADAQISKPELHKVVEIADSLISVAGAKLSARQGDAGLQKWLTPAAGDPKAALQQVQAELSPAWEVEEDNPPPSESNPRLWQTFRAELADRARHLRKLFDKAPGEPDAVTQQEVARTLHTIKSAAMVVPVGEVTHVTHRLENLIEPASQAKHGWPAAQLSNYVDWLDDLTMPGQDLRRLLALGRTMCEQLMP